MVSVCDRSCAHVRGGRPGSKTRLSPCFECRNSVRDGNTVVSIAADGALRRAQTWQDNDGYHVIVPYASAHNSVKPARGIKVRQIGQSLEILIQNNPAAPVSAQVDDNHLNITVHGKLEPRSEAAIDKNQSGAEENLWQS